jgi:hypothetical protein
VADARRCSEIDDQQREVKGFVAAGPLDRLCDAVHQQQAIGEPGEPIGHHRHGHVGLRAIQADRASGLVPDDHAAT